MKLANELDLRVSNPTSWICEFPSKCVENTKSVIESVLKILFEMSDQLKPEVRGQRLLNGPL